MYNIAIRHEPNRIGTYVAAAFRNYPIIAPEKVYTEHRLGSQSYLAPFVMDWDGKELLQGCGTRHRKWSTTTV